MKKIQNKIFGLLFVFAALSAAVFSQNGASSQKPVQDSEIAEKVKRAFDPSRKYDYRWADEIKPLGKKIIPHLEPYLNDSDTSVRLAVLGLLKDIKEPESIPLLAKAARDSAWQISNQATLYLYDNYDHAVIGQYAEVGSSLRAGIAGSNKSIAAVILLGYFPGRETEAALLAASDDTAVSFWSRKIAYEAEISLKLPVYLTLFRLNAPNSYEQLTGKIKGAEPDEVEFLLYALDFIDNPELLKIIFEKGISIRQIPQAELGIEGQRMPNAMRVADLTINKFAQKLNINLGFKLQQTAYSPKKLASAQQKISQELAAK